ncbi:hypothetical protein ACQ5SO_10175 [Rhodovulum sp. DZ06]|uniref:hypothetical protein n=1 Tax=Rhodovulum sp. DZ06 TaxID=3425126 RepID=UPI003D3598EC
MAGLEGVTLGIRIGPVATQPVPPDVAAAFEGAEVTQASGGRSGFQLSFLYSKTSPIATQRLPGGYFDPLNRVILTATLGGVTRVLADGPVKRADVDASAVPGRNRLTLTGEDVLGYMDAIDFTGMPYPAVPASVRVLMMLAKYPMFGVIPKVLPAPGDVIHSPTDRIPAQQGSDLEYMTRLAQDAGYVLYAEPGPKPGMNTVYWGPEMRLGTEQPALTLDMDQARNVDSLSFTADGDAAEQKFAFVKAANFSVPVPVPNVGLLKPPLAGRPIVPSRLRLMETERLGAVEAIGLALGGAARGDPLTASGTLDVARYGAPLEARKLATVRGAGIAHDGTWYVSSVTHRLKPGSWTQAFSLARDGLLPRAFTPPPLPATGVPT